MLKFGNREFRNLQEQVLKNMCDIQDIEQGATVLANFGITVVGQVNQASDLPAPATYTGKLGDAFLVGTQAPYIYYIYAKAYDGQEQAAWYNLGQFPLPGPKGDQGNAAGFGTVSATATSIVGQPTVSVSTSGTNEAKNIAFEFGIPDVNPEYVEANPTASATGTLEKLRVNNTVYSVGGVKCYTGAEDIGEGSTYPLNTFEGIKVGDIVSDFPSGQVFIAQYVGNSEINLYGIASDSEQIAVTLQVQNNMWVVNNYIVESRTQLYRHEISGILDNNANARLIIYSTSSNLLNDRYKLMYNTEHILRISYCNNITSSQRDIVNVIDVSFNTGAYKVILVYFSGSTPTEVQINSDGYTDTVTKIYNNN